MRLTTLIAVCCLAISNFLTAQVTLNGLIIDASNGDPLIGATVLVKGTANGTVSDIDGSWQLTVSGLPIILQFSYTGYAPTEIEVSSTEQDLTIRLGDNAITTDVVEVRGRRISEKQQQAALTVETLDAIGIKETPAADFYDGLGSLKDVDLTAASLGFKIINTRGFNSTNPVRSLQIIDGVDNQSPGLNFSLGNFLGASELDVNRVNLVVGASSAFYGPNAFNGVIAMETKDPFLQQGLSAQLKVAERNLIKGGFRYAHALANAEGEEWFAYKINLEAFRADDWVADNYDPVYNTDLPADNPGGYDAVNRYGDEANSIFNYSRARNLPGLGIIRRAGYREEDLVDYDSENLKAGAAFHFRLNPSRGLESTELLLASNFSTGTTVYQGDNRFSLRDIKFFQHRIELRNRDDFFLRAYATHEDAGNSYDPYFTALRLQEASKSDSEWASSYAAYWQGTIVKRFRERDDFPQCFPVDCSLTEQDARRAEYFAREDIRDLLQEYHAETRTVAEQARGFDTYDRYEVGTERFQRAFDSITTTLASEGGTRFFDKSALFHLHGEKTFADVWQPNADSRLELTVGANGRLYTPNSKGTILLDTFGRNIDTWEVGAYGGGTLHLNNRYKVSASLRADKNQNFDLLFSPAASLVYTPTPTSTARLSFSSAIRNPTLNDQYLFYNVGRAILLGNIDGITDLVTVPSLINFSNTGDQSQLEYFDIDPIRPEKVRTFEAGYRTTVLEKVYLDATYYYSFYEDFIGYNIGVDVQTNGALITGAQPYRVSANARDRVTTQGFSIGGNYYFARFYTLNGNYSWNKLNTATEDPIIPAFNTPEHKYNVGVSGRDVPLNLFGNPVPGLGFSVAYKWIEGYLFEGSPQFTGLIESYGLLDAQINFDIPKINTNIKFGASNLLNREVYQVYGGPNIGRLAYLTATYDWNNR
ncbi:outer membrane receptor protein involved in Fe transport [Lewinella marina]|uniref:TonB-dependent receptor n=1 Tax=Neolewinella marina TaxID=438751 RepID=A0A2G0CDK2_9BACT|nr:TonB-dependent receptor [Neolewinella marina]NJB86034.1 outer membrane receptor protein involved in Fe transport [Neolewinella marina]PHK98000.1 TonB-dependent receptor [Neolewinella marina]